MIDRIGKFVIDRGLIGRAPKAALAMLSGCVVVRAEMMWHSDCIEYMALSERFDPVPQGMDVPRYDVTVHDLAGGKYHVEWRRQQEGMR